MNFFKKEFTKGKKSQKKNKKITNLSFVLGVSVHRAKLLSAVRKLTFDAVPTATKLFPRAAQLSL
jgi:hypothetical protein